MGDGGSLFLGFVISSVGVHTQAKSNTALALTVCVLSLGLPIIDTLLSIIRRISRGKDPFSADREHIHHRLLALGLTPRQVALYPVRILRVFGIIRCLPQSRGGK